jgi:hypothetical protein
VLYILFRLYYKIGYAPTDSAVAALVPEVTTVCALTSLSESDKLVVKI